jgi:DNA polymerase-1
MKTFDELNPKLNPILVTNEEDAIRACAVLLEKVGDGGVFGLDVETNVVPSFVNRKCRTIQLGTRDVQYIFDLLSISGSTQALMEQGNYQCPKWFANIAKALEPLLCSSHYTKAGYSLQFECEVFSWSFGMDIFGLFDSALAERLLLAGKVHPKSSGYFAADDIVAKYTGFKMSKDLQKSFDLESPLTDEQLIYAAADVRFPMATMNGQIKQLTQLGLMEVMEIENNAIMWFAKAKLNGFYCDQKTWFDLCDACEEKHKENVAELDKYFVPIVGQKQLDAPVYNLDFLEARWKDEKKDKVLRAAYRKDFEEARRQIKEFDGSKDLYEGMACINYDSPTQVLEALKKMGFKKLKDTNDRSLKGIDSPVIKALQAYRTTGKLLKSYGKSFYNSNVTTETGRIHATLSQLGTETGRTSCFSPNLQNIPTKNPDDPNTFDWRLGFQSMRDGYTLVVADFDGCELRIMAEISGEQSWIDAFNQGKDVHSISAHMVLGQEWEDAALPDCKYMKTGAKCSCKMHKIMRDWIKAVNFGIAYGMAAGKLSDSIGRPKEECEQILARWKAKLKKLAAMLDKSGTTAKMTGIAKTIAGRIRNFNKPTWDKCEEYVREDCKGTDKKVESWMVSKKMAVMYGSIEREGKNTPIQGSNADIAKRAMKYLFFSKLKQLGFLPVMFVHDEFIYEGPTENAEEAKTIIEDCMLRAGADFVKSIKMPASGKVTKTWEK